MCIGGCLHAWLPACKAHQHSAIQGATHFCVSQVIRNIARACKPRQRAGAGAGLCGRRPGAGAPGGRRAAEAAGRQLLRPRRRHARLLFLRGAASTKTLDHISQGDREGLGLLSAMRSRSSCLNSPYGKPSEPVAQLFPKRL